MEFAHESREKEEKTWQQQQEAVQTFGGVDLLRCANVKNSASIDITIYLSFGCLTRTNLHLSSVCLCESVRVWVCYAFQNLLIEQTMTWFAFKMNEAINS